MAKRREIKAVLVIEDEANVRNFASRVLELKGYHLPQADDGEGGSALAREKKSTLVLLSMRLLGRDSWVVSVYRLS